MPTVSKSQQDGLNLHFFNDPRKKMELFKGKKSGETCECESSSLPLRDKKGGDIKRRHQGSVSPDRPLLPLYIYHAR